MTDQRNSWELPASDRDMDPFSRPWPFHMARQSVELATTVADFVEMLCQLDSRLDSALPAGWMSVGYLFALMDALRCEYAFAYCDTRDKKGNPIPRPPSRDQFQFWLDENVAVDMVKNYCSQNGITREYDGERAASFSAATTRRRRAEASNGIEAVDCYPFGDSVMARESTADMPEDAGIPPDIPPGTEDVVF